LELGLSRVQPVSTMQLRIALEAGSIAHGHSCDWHSSGILHSRSCIASPFLRYSTVACGQAFRPLQFCSDRPFLWSNGLPLGDRSSPGGYMSYRGTNFGDRNSWAIFAAWKIVMRT
jgi:hypothetical protein